MFNYKINIAMHERRPSGLGRASHFALISLPMGITELAARNRFADFCEKFPASEGYSLDLQKHPVESYTTIAYSEGA